LEDELSVIEEKQADPAIATNSAKLNELATKHFDISQKLEPLYNEWDELTNQV
jgi:ATP-binding cassette subfamily F protein 3